MTQEELRELYNERVQRENSVISVSRQTLTVDYFHSSKQEKSISIRISLSV